jgi:hypothetical protein
MKGIGFVARLSRRYVSENKGSCFASSVSKYWVRKNIPEPFDEAF